MKKILIFGFVLFVALLGKDVLYAQAQVFDQDIVLLDRLKIVNISSPTFPTTIIALADTGSVCKQYEGELDESPATIPCEYGRFEIEVTSKTVIRTKEGIKRTANIFLIGDAIRVYGVASMSGNSVAVKAKAARDLGPALLVPASVSVTTRSSTQSAVATPPAEVVAPAPSPAGNTNLEEDIAKARQLANTLVSMRILLERMLSGALGR